MRPYKRNMYCNWRIQSDPDSSVKIKFLHFEIEYSERCDYDSLEISEEQSFQRNTNHGKYCGNRVNIGNSKILEKNNVLTLFVLETPSHCFLFRHHSHTLSIG